MRLAQNSPKVSNLYRLRKNSLECGSFGVTLLNRSVPGCDREQGVTGDRV